MSFPICNSLSRGCFRRSVMEPYCRDQRLIGTAYLCSILNVCFERNLKSIDSRPRRLHRGHPGEIDR